ncbi:unnamed protein product [Thlaspi arvense]|uniref:Ribosomal protein S12 n=1 Tax=Thlaspi arvense TaxID=13288 RepID=A0AAU9RX94_THLAR|nr:unnamed protein product [Thlaspi arvense]
MPTSHQLIRHGREEKRRTDRTRALDKCPQKQGVCPRVSTRTPKKPNSTPRKIAKVRLSNRHDIFAHIPGEGHNSQEHSQYRSVDGTITTLRPKIKLYGAVTNDHNGVYYTSQERVHLTHFARGGGRGSLRHARASVTDLATQSISSVIWLLHPREGKRMRKVTVEGGKAPYFTRSKRSSIKQEDLCLPRALFHPQKTIFVVYQPVLPHTSTSGACLEGVPLSRETGVPRGVQAKRCHSRRKGSSKEEVGLKRKRGRFQNSQAPSQLKVKGELRCPKPQAKVLGVEISSLQVQSSYLRTEQSAVDGSFFPFLGNGVRATESPIHLLWSPPDLGGRARIRGALTSVQQIEVSTTSLCRLDPGT